VPQYLVCVPVTGSPSVSPCTDAGGIAHVPVMMEQPAIGSISFENADLLFAYAFGAVLGFWAIGVAVGAILSLIRKGE